MTDRLDIHPDIRRSSTLPGSFYKSQDLFDELTEKAFAGGWHFLGSEAQFAAPSQATPIELMPSSLAEPLAILSDASSALRVVSNVCTHRANLVVTRAAECKGLRCDYHGRRFGLDGRCTSSPDFDDEPGFPASTDHLPELALERLGPLLFTSLAQGSRQLGFDEWALPLRERLGSLWDEPYVFDAEGSQDYYVEAHWALYVDNFLEGFHIPYVHPELNKLLVASSYETELQAWSNLQLGDARPGDLAFDAQRVGRDAGRNLAAYYAWLFPGLMLNFYPWGLSVNVIEPLGLERTRVRFLRYIAHPDLVGQGAGGDLDGVQREDELVVEAVQRGVKSRLYRAGRFSAQQERGVHHFHALLAACLKAN